MPTAQRFQGVFRSRQEQLVGLDRILTPRSCVCQNADARRPHSGEGSYKTPARFAGKLLSDPIKAAWLELPSRNGLPTRMFRRSASVPEALSVGKVTIQAFGGRSTRTAVDGGPRGRNLRNWDSVPTRSEQTGGDRDDMKDACLRPQQIGTETQLNPQLPESECTTALPGRRWRDQSQMFWGSLGFSVREIWRTHHDRRFAREETAARKGRLAEVLLPCGTWRTRARRWVALVEEGRSNAVHRLARWGTGLSQWHTGFRRWSSRVQGARTRIDIAYCNEDRQRLLQRGSTAPITWIAGSNLAGRKRPEAAAGHWAPAGRSTRRTRVSSVARANCLPSGE